MNPTLIQELLACRARQLLERGTGMGMEAALRTATAEILRQEPPGLGHADRFCFRALVRGAGNRLRCAASGVESPCP